MDISLVASAFVPSTSFTGDEPPTLVRGKNAVIRAAEGRARIENYPGSSDLSENYNIASESLTGTITWTVSTQTPTGTGTLFTTELRIGQMVLIGDEPCVVQRIIDDTHFISDRPAVATQTTQSARYMYMLQELNRQRLVARRVSGVTIDKKDIVFNGDGLVYMNGTSTTFTATRRPKRMQRAAAGSYTEFAIGFDTVPPAPVITITTGGWKAMQAGKYSFLVSYWNSVTGEFSNPCPVIKKDGGATDIEIAASGRFEFDFTTSLVGMPGNADGFIIWGSQSGGGVSLTNIANFQQGAWLAVKKIRSTAYSVVDADVDPSTDRVTISGHKFRTADSIYVGGTVAAGLVLGTEYFAIVVDANTVKFATTAANANTGTAIDITADPGGTMIVRSMKVADDKTFIEYLDAEMGATASGDNDPPPDCEFVTEFSNQLFCVSSLGKTTSTRPLGTSPGNYAMPGKQSNRGAFPSDWRVSVGDEITGYANAAGRLFCLTPVSVQFITATGRTELARLVPTLQDLPFTSRPFWTKGGNSPYNLCVVQGDLFVYTGRTLLRSPSTADPVNAVPYEIGLPVSDLTKNWYDGYAFLGHDPKNQQLCIISSATHKNTAGYWVSQILPYSLQKNQWQPIIELTSDTRDMIVSGVATVNGRMEFLAGGRAPAGAYSIGTFRYDEATSGTHVSAYIAFQTIDFGEEGKQKSIKSFRLTHRTTSGILQIHGARAGGTISIDDIEAGTNSLSGNITVPTAAVLTRDFIIRHLVKGLQLISVRFAWEWDGAGEVDRIDEIVISGSLHGTAQ